MTKPLPQHVLDNRSNQLNPIHPTYYLSRGASPTEAQASASEQALVLAEQTSSGGSGGSGGSAPVPGRYRAGTGPETRRKRAG